MNSGRPEDPQKNVSDHNNNALNPSVKITSNVDISKLTLHEDYFSDETNKQPDNKNNSNMNIAPIKPPPQIMEDDFHDIHADLPVKARPMYEFAFETRFENIEPEKIPVEIKTDILKDKYFIYESGKSGSSFAKSFHMTASAHKTFGKKTEYVTKFNPGPGFFCDYAYMPQIESGLSEVAAYYGGSKLFATGYPVYNSKHKIVLMASRKFKNWQANKTHPLTKDQTKDSAKLKQLAKMLFWKFALKEGDYNANNSGNYFIDNDMLMWSVTYLFKKLDPIQAAKRNPRAKTFAVTENNIRNFPDLPEADINPWVTKKSRTSGSTSSNSTPSTTVMNFLQDTLHASIDIVRDKLKKYYPETDNDFSEDLQTVYKELAQSAEFMRYVYIEILRFILSTRDIDEAALKLHFRDSDIYTPNKNKLSLNSWYSNDPKLTGKKLSEMYADDIQDNRIKFRDTALQMPEFQEFLEQHGEAALKEISADFEANNKKYANKISKIENQLSTPPPSNVPEIGKPETDSPQRLKYKKERYRAMRMNMNDVKLRYHSIFTTANKIKERTTLQEFDMDEFDTPPDLTTKKNN